MIEQYLDAPLFEINKSQRGVDLVQNPYFYNDMGSPTYLEQLPAGAEHLYPAADNPGIAMGNEYIVSNMLPPSSSSYGVETQMQFVAEKVEFAPLWVTPAIASAFGITLVKPGQGLRIDSPWLELAQVEYEYGVFAGHWSPYQNTGNRLLTVVCTDLEHHDFPHVFASTDPNEPLVISVGRYWPKLHRIRLADLWVPRGWALYIPPKPNDPDADCIDLHNNRNSARACWGGIGQSSVTTHTLLRAEGGYFYWYWNANDTGHGQPLQGTGA